jgi:hypothetical protein
VYVKADGESRLRRTLQPRKSLSLVRFVALPSCRACGPGRFLIGRGECKRDSACGSLCYRWVHWVRELLLWMAAAFAFICSGGSACLDIP